MFEKVFFILSLQIGEGFDDVSSKVTQIKSHLADQQRGENDAQKCVKHARALHAAIIILT